MKTLSGNRYFAETLKAHGISHFFCVPVIAPGAIREMTGMGIVPVVTHAEKSAAYMADGYARVSRRPGFCGAQNIGATNLAAGLRDAYLSRNPVVAITGGATPKIKYRGFYQDLDDMPVYEALTKFNARIDAIDRLPDLLQGAIRAATTGEPRPVHLEIGHPFGMGLMDEELQADLSFDERYARFPAHRTMASETDIDRAIQELSRAERPVIVAGGGVKSSAAEDTLLAFARKTSIPVATSLNARGIIPDDDPLALGVSGEYSVTSANRSICESDLVFFIGSATGGLVTRNWVIPGRDTRVIHVDICADNIGRNYLNTLALCGDAKTVLEQLIGKIGASTSREAWLNRIREYKSDWLNTIRENESSTAVPMRPERLCRELSESLPDNAIVVGDTGHAAAWLAQNIRASSPGQSFIRAHGSLGWAFPASVGAKCAEPGRPVISFSGDGGFYYHQSELETALRYGINVIAVINNNYGLNQEQSLWIDNDDYEKNWRFRKTDFAAVAEAHGCIGIRVEDPGDFKAAMQQALAADRPVVIDAISDSAACSVPPWLPEGVKQGFGN